MTGAVKVGPNSLVQVGPRLPVSPRHADPLLAAPGLLASDAANYPGVKAVDGSVDSGHRGGHGGLDHLALAGGTVSTLPHSLTLHCRLGLAFVYATL